MSPAPMIEDARKTRGHPAVLADAASAGQHIESDLVRVAPVTCETCAAGCCRLEVWCLTDTGVPGHLTVTDSFGRTLMDRLDDGWCAALDRDTLRCRIYAQRPLVCRELEVGSPECLAERG